MSKPADRTLCPEPESLQRLLRDEPDPNGSAHDLEEHVATCADCQKVLEEMLGSAPDMFGPSLEELARLSDDEPPELPGYEPVGRIDAGGMGVIWRVRDLEFQRTLAAKVMKARACADPHLRRRFLAEARITGRLAHPSIVPIHARGRLLDGRPYFTMKLVEGETLAARLRREPAAPRAELVRAFAQVCQAVAYAHAQGIIHRDLKPANVMVGSFGEVQVMDWGLAKELRTEEPGTEDEPSVSLLPQDPRSHETRSGAVMGTLPYMPPEQARGEVARLDPRCDVFNLGAILCEILTGAPPYHTDTRAAVLHRAARGELAECFARLDACGADAELVRLARVCLAPDREQRPLDAGAVAAAVAEFEADVEKRLRQTEVQRAEAQVRTGEERKRRRLATGLAAVVLAGVVGLAVGAGLLAQKNRQLVATNGELDSARTEAVTKGAQAAQARDRKTEALVRATEALDVTTSEIAGDSLETQVAVTPRQQKFLATVLPLYEEFAREQGDDEATRARVAAAAHRIGLIQYRLGFHEAAVGALERACAAYERLDADFPSAARYRLELARSHNNRGIVLRYLGQLTRAERAFRTVVGLRERLAAESPTPDRRCALARSFNNLGLMLEELGTKAEEARHAFQHARTIGQKLVDEFPNAPDHQKVLASTHIHLGTLAMRSGRLPAAEEHFQRALTIGQKLATERAEPEYRFDLAKSLYGAATLLRRRGKGTEAVDHYQRARDIYQKLADEYRAAPEYRRELAVSTCTLGLMKHESDRSPDAEPEVRRALDIQQKLVAEFPPVLEYRSDLFTGRRELGRLLRARGKWDEAEAVQRQALADIQKLAAEFSHVPSYQRELAGCHAELGQLFRAGFRARDAEGAYRQALDVLQKPAAEFPDVPVYRYGVAGVHFSLGELFERTNRRTEAEEHYRRAIAVLQKLVGEVPDAPDYRLDLAVSFGSLGRLLSVSGKWGQARAAHRQGMALWEKLVGDFPGADSYQIKYAGNRVNFATLLRDEGAPAEAVGEYDRAIAELAPRAGSGSGEARMYLQAAYAGRATAVEVVDGPAAALADWDKAVELAPPPQRPSVRCGRAAALVRADKVERAVGEAAELAKIPGESPVQLYNLACVYGLAAARDEKNRAEHITRALELLRRAAERGFRDAAHMRTDDDLKVLRDDAEFRKLLDELEAPKK